MCCVCCCFIFHLMLGDFGLCVVCVAVYFSADVGRLWVVCCTCVCVAV